MPFSTILFDKQDSIAAITLNRPERLNAFTAQMHAELREAMDAIESDPALRALMITGSGRGFCAGQDLAEQAMESSGDVSGVLEQNYNPLLRRLRALPFPVVCAVNGVAAGAGCNFALACDIVIAAQSATFIQAFARIGLIPDAGGTYVLPRLVGTSRAMALAMLGEALPAQRAAEWGMIWKCVPDGELSVRSKELTRHLAGQATHALGLTKKALYASWGSSFEEQLALEATLQADAAASEDFREGVAAFRQKRAPSFRGR